MNGLKWLRVSLGVVVSLALLSPAPSAAQSAERYRSVPANADGIGKSYLGRQISHVMGWQGAAWLEREEREREERSDLLLPMLRLSPGAVVADIGAGSGYYTRRIADAVSATGRVYAVDVQPEMVSMLRKLAQQRPNVTPVLSSVTDVKLPAASVDLAIMVDVYHELEYPFEVLDSIVRAVKPGGRVVFVEYRAEDPRVPIKPLHKMTEAQIRKEAEVHALEWERTENALPWQHVVVFRKK